MADANAKLERLRDPSRDGLRRGGAGSHDLGTHSKRTLHLIRRDLAGYKSGSLNASLRVVPG